MGQITGTVGNQGNFPSINTLLIIFFAFYPFPFVYGSLGNHYTYLIVLPAVEASQRQINIPVPYNRIITMRTSP